MDKYHELKTEYDAFVSWLCGRVPETDTEAVLTYYTAVTLKLWGANLLYSPDYAALLSAVTGTRYTLEQIVTAMGCCGDPERELLTPGFFGELIENDRIDGTASAAAAVDKLSSLFAASAMINGDFTVEEASALSDVLTGLNAYAASRGVRSAAEPDFGRQITARKEDSYLRNDALLDAAKRAGQRADESARAGDGGDGSAAINITINVTADGALAADGGDEPGSEQVTPPEAPPSGDENETLESLLAELDSLVGLENVKQDIHSLINFIRIAKVREQRGMKVPTISYHLVFTGNPGTGKTTVARLVGRLYYRMGILPKGQLVETDRSALVAGYLGQTAIKTQKVIQQAMGGVLFIDEAYSLAGEEQDSYGREAIETILKAMEDHRDELVVIVAGYTDLMHRFIESNPGLSSRFSKYFEYPDYTAEELLAIFRRFCANSGYRLDAQAEALLAQRFERLYACRDEHFGNARTARNLFEKAINAQANRIAGKSVLTDADLEIITAADIEASIGGDM